MSLKRFWTILLVGLAACGQAPAATQSSLPASPLPVPAAGTYLYLRDPGGEIAVSLPSGYLGKAGTVLSPDSRRAYSLAAPAQSGKSQLLVRDIPSMTLLKRLELDAGWSLPAITRTDSGAAGEPGGLSADGHWLVLTGTHPQGSSTRFLVLDTTFSKPARDISIQGAFEFDAINDAGTKLFLIEHRSDGTYKVRFFDLAIGRLDPNIIFDKRDPGERMRGVRIDSVAEPNGAWLQSAYSTGAGKGFIHSLVMTPNNPYSYCTDLPKGSIGGWKLAAGSDRLYAFSPADGVLAEISLREPPSVLRTLTLPNMSAARNPLVVDATAKEVLGGGGRPTLSPDRRTLYLPTDQAVWVVDAASFSVRSRLLAGSHPTGLAVDPDGWLYASTMTSSEVLRLDPRTGQVAGRIPGNMGAALLRVQVLN